MLGRSADRGSCIEQLGQTGSGHSTFLRATALTSEITLSPALLSLCLHVTPARNTGICVISCVLQGERRQVTYLEAPPGDVGVA